VYVQLVGKQRVDTCGAKGTHFPCAMAGTLASDDLSTVAVGVKSPSSFRIEFDVQRANVGFTSSIIQNPGLEANIWASQGFSIFIKKKENSEAVFVVYTAKQGMMVMDKTTSIRNIFENTWSTLQGWLILRVPYRISRGLLA
jgi:hypothetical protein